MRDSRMKRGYGETTEIWRTALAAEYPSLHFEETERKQSANPAEPLKRWWAL